jgi:hypothetical protein
MTITVEQAAAFVAVAGALIAGAWGIGRIGVLVGEVLRRIDDLAQRHGELAKESREGRANIEQRLAALERVLKGRDA